MIENWALFWLAHSVGWIVLYVVALWRLHPYKRRFLSMLMRREVVHTERCVCSCEREATPTS